MWDAPKFYRGFLQFFKSFLGTCYFGVGNEELAISILKNLKIL